mgnify:CR=1 FL=1
MKKHEEPLSPEALLLDRYLGQYKRCIRRKRALERRRDEIVKEFEYPLGSVNYDGMPKGSGEGVGCAALSFRLDEIDTRIKEQLHKSVKVLASIMDVIEFLPENSIERSIFEHRYIDRMSWERICNEVHLSRTPSSNHWKRGLYELLEFKKIQQLMSEYDKELKENDFMGDY